MPRQRKEKKAKDLKLRQPDRSGPSEQTLLQFAEQRDLFKLADKQQRKNNNAKKEKVVDNEKEEENEDEDEEDTLLSSGADRLMDTILYAVCLAMLHFTLDFLVQQQYAMEIEYKKMVERAFQALMGSSDCSAQDFFFADIYFLQYSQHLSTLSILTQPTPPSSPACPKNTTALCAKPSSFS